MICLMPNCAYLSETSRMIALWRALADLDAPVMMASHGGVYAGLLEDAGAGYEQVGPVMDDERSRRFVRQGPGLGPPTQSFYSDEELHAYALAEAALFRRNGVTAVVTGFTLTPLLSTRLAGIPLFAEHGGSFVPPVVEANLPPAMALPRAAIFRWMPRALARRMQNAHSLKTDFYTAGFNRVAAALGVEPVPGLMTLMTGDITLVTEAEQVLGVPRAVMEGWRARPGVAVRPGTRMRYVGPIFAELDLPVPPRVEAFLAGKGPLIYAAPTSTDAALARSIVVQAAATGARVLVASTAHALADLEGRRVMIEPVLPSHRIMPRADLAIIAGGQGSIQSALAAGTPVVMLPLQREQDLNAEIVRRRGAGIVVPPHKVGSDRIRRAATRILRSSAYGRAARRIAAIYADLDGPARAAEVILEELAAWPKRKAG